MAKKINPSSPPKNKYIRNRVLDLSDRKEKFEEILEAAKSLVKAIEEKGWETVKKEYLQDLKQAAKEAKEVYTGPDSFRVNYAQRRYSMLIEQGLSEEEALKKIAYEMGYRKVDKVKRMIRLKPAKREPDYDEKE